MIQLPDKWVRKAIKDRIHNIDVDLVGTLNTIPCFDSFQSTGKKRYYTLLSTQTNELSKDKCGNGWESSILIDVVTKFSNASNPGSRVMADDIANEILQELEDLNLDPTSNLTISAIDIIFEPDIISFGTTQNVFRKLIRYELTIN